MNKLATNIKALMKDTGLSRRQLAERLNVGETTIKNIETGYSAYPKLIERIAAVFDTTADGLLGKSPLDVGEKTRLVYVTDCISNEKPLLNMNNVIDTMFVDKEKLLGYEHIGFKINDNSMVRARLCKGDIVLVRQTDIVGNKDIVLAVYGKSDAVVRRYYKNENIVTLKAECDEDIYPDVTIDTDKERFVIIGKIISCIIEL